MAVNRFLGMIYLPCLFPESWTTAYLLYSPIKSRLEVCLVSSESTFVLSFDISLLETYNVHGKRQGDP